MLPTWNTLFSSKTVHGTSLVITSCSIKDSTWHLVRYHKLQHQREYMALRSLSHVAAPKTVYGTSLVITSGSIKDSIWHFAHYHKCNTKDNIRHLARCHNWQHQRKHIWHFARYHKCNTKDSIRHLVRYHKWQHQNQYMALRSLSQVATPKTVYGTSLVITSGNTKGSIWHFAPYRKF